MKERPILFNGDMVRAILDGMKTQTRRVVKLVDFMPCDMPGSDWFFRVKGIWSDVPNQSLIERYCPYGKPGDRLWVRETHVFERFDAEFYEPCDLPPVSYDRPILHRNAEEPNFEYWLKPHYRSTDPAPELAYDNLEGPGCRWLPSIHMPRWASRITLEITGIRVERVQDISDDDAEAEGMIYYGETLAEPIPPEKFRTLWDSINKKKNPWSSNPWVWVIEFKRVEA